MIQPRYMPVFFFLLIGLSTHAQQDVPVIRASSKTVTVRDGLHLKKGYWYIMPEKKPDYYFVEIPHKQHRVTFITDKDSITFDVQYGEEYDFIILLNDRDSCYTRIAARNRKDVSYTHAGLSETSDTIPFTVGNNSKIYLKGKINDSAPLDIQFDLGSGGSLIKKSSVKKVDMQFDGTLTLRNSDGTNEVPLSRNNILEIAGLKWDSLEFAVADNMTSREDLIVGNYLFQNKIIEINYDKKVMVIHDSLPALDTGYSRHDMIRDGVVPFIPGSLTLRDKTIDGWFMFDTGAYTTILQTDELPARHKMLIEFRKMLGLSNRKAGFLSPGLTIGDYSFSNINYTISRAGSDPAQLGLLGNDLLKRFNVLLDNQQGNIYLKPNSLANVPYSNPEYYVVRVALGILVLLATLIVFIIYRRRGKRKRRARAGL